MRVRIPPPPPNYIAPAWAVLNVALLELIHVTRNSEQSAILGSTNDGESTSIHGPFTPLTRGNARSDPKPPYPERGPIWSVGVTNNSLLTPFSADTTSLNFTDRKLSNQSYDWEVIDGQQRLRAIWDFMANGSLPFPKTLIR